MNRNIFKFSVVVILLMLVACNKEEKRHPAEPEMITVKGGTFIMGCTDGDCSEDGSDLPAHKVKLSSFKISKYPVTQKQWASIMGNDAILISLKGDDFPVNVISWYYTQVFIKKLNEITGKNYRLPTEAEWEFAARGGNKSKGYKYSGSNDINAVAWYSDNSEGYHNIGTKNPNELGIYDMSGSIWEWCNDWYEAYTDVSQTNPMGPAIGDQRVLRGGWFCSAVKDCRVSTREVMDPNIHNPRCGFRLVLP